MFGFQCGIFAIFVFAAVPGRKPSHFNLMPFMGAENVFTAQSAYAMEFARLVEYASQPTPPS